MVALNNHTEKVKLGKNAKPPIPVVHTNWIGACQSVFSPVDESLFEWKEKSQKSPEVCFCFLRSVAVPSVTSQVRVGPVLPADEIIRQHDADRA